ncbi:MAG: DUF6089 family protein [Chitinophagaceae bacterium]|nr:DUF6089 family protein [Chitinophagaceae bacterium]
MVQSLTGMGQGFDIDMFAGISNYQGDLQPIFFTVQNSNPGAAIILKYGFSKRFYLRGGFTFGSVAASDANNREDLRPRNLSFRSGIQEFTAGFEYRFIDPDRFRVTPYIFAGAGVFRFNPYAYGDGYEGRVYLQPLGTEGQGLSLYPDRTPYNLTQFCIPYGFGIKWQINCNLNMGVEFRQTKLFTDYLDDVSTNYADQAALLQARGQKAVDFAWRGDEFNGAPYPAAGNKRGNPGENDWYYFAGITLGLRLQDCETGTFSLGGLFNRNKGQRPRAKIDCPRVW